MFNSITHIERRGTNCEKWDGMAERFGSNDLLPLWVADMDFAPPDEIIKAIKKRLEHPVFGYTFRAQSWKDAIIGWVARRHDFEILPEWIEFSPGVVPAISTAILSFTKEGDGVLIQPPIYPPFRRSVLGGARRIVENPLKFTGTRFEMDFDDLEGKLSRENVRLALLCSPHNPSGRVWTRDELTRFAEICERHNVLIFSDEIHSDIVYSGHKHVPIASISRDTITSMSPSKTFNLAGLSTSEVIIPNAELRERFAATLDFLHIAGGNIFGAVAAEAAYNFGDSWLDTLIGYLEGNLKIVSEFFESNFPELRLVYPEGTYVPLVDCRALGMDAHSLQKAFTEARVALNGGHTFGKHGEGFMRINVATSRENLEEGLRRICSLRRK